MMNLSDEIAYIVINLIKKRIDERIEEYDNQIKYYIEDGQQEAAAQCENRKLVYKEVKELLK